MSRFRLSGRFRPRLARCRRCGALATWHYMPAGEWKPEWIRYFCDVCVPRGCDCQWDSDRNAPYRDKRGRRLPCVEFDYWWKGFLLDRRGRIEWRRGRHSWRFVTRLPIRGHKLRRPIAWYVSGGRTWAAPGTTAREPA